MTTMASEILTLPNVVLAVTCVLVAFLVKTAAGFYKTFKQMQKLPGLKYSPLLGNLQFMPKDGEGKFQMGLHFMEKINSKMICFWMGPVTPDIMVYHPDTVGVVLQSLNADKSRGLGKAYEYGVPWVGEGILTSNGETWSRSRKLLNPSFHSDILKNYMTIYNQAADKMLKKLDKFAETGESFDICPILTMCTLEIIMRCFLSYDGDVQGHEQGHHPYATAVMELSHVWSVRHWNPLIWPDWIFRLTSTGKKFYKNCDYVHKVADDIIKEKMKNRKEEKNQQGAKREFIDILLSARDEDGQPMTPLEIREQVDSFMFAGHDTVSTTLGFNVFNLAQHPEYQRRVQEEIDSVVNGRTNDEVEWEDLSQFKTLVLCSKESQRLYPPVPFINRVLTKDTVLEGVTIPAGTTTTICMVYLHVNPTVWDKPLEYRPERFLEDDIDKFAFVPFSAGHRNCIGQVFGINEEKVVLSKLFHRYDVQPAPDHDLPTRDLAAVLKAENGIWVTVKRR